MRFLLKVSIPVEAGNNAIRNGSLAKTIETILGELKPEAAYFADEDGKRTGYIFLEMKDASEVPAIAEPWFLSLNAEIQLHPAMNVEDLKRAAPHMERAAKKYGQPLTRTAG
jgi:hypothetical protein